MRQDIKEQWVNALRSGAFRQGQRYLAKEGGYCCLGVLCELAYRAGEIAEKVNTGDGGEDFPRIVEYDGAVALLPESVSEWADLNFNPMVWSEREGFPVFLTALNDRGVPFTELADIIERYL